MDWRERITVNPEILVGKPVIKDTRLGSEEDVLRNYPGLTSDDIKACLSYAGEMIRSERVYPIAS